MALRSKAVGNALDRLNGMTSEQMPPDVWSIICFCNLERLRRFWLNGLPAPVSGAQSGWVALRLLS